MSSSCPSKIKEVNVVVVGLSGSEAVKGTLGVGKSLLCNRFVRPAADDFFREHSSVLSQIDFCGSPVINKDHWLYWGSRTLTSSEGISVSIKVVEQTEFLDDETFETIAGCSMSENYLRRCCKTSLQSRDKLMYIQKEQLGSESDFPQNYLPDGKFNVDGFIITCDVSQYSENSEVTGIIQAIAKTKKPTIIAFTKCDELSEKSRKFYLNLFSSCKELKHILNQLSPVETSSVNNVNVDYAFGALANLCLRSHKTIKKPIGYHEASLYVEQRNLHVKCAFSALLSQAVPLCVNPQKCLSWKQVLGDIDRHPDFMSFVTVYGNRVAFEMYERYVSEAREIWAMNRLRSLVPRLFEVFQTFLDVVDLASMEWNTARSFMRSHPLFNVFFESNDLWTSSTLNFEAESRIPGEILLLPEASKVFDQFKLATHTQRLKFQLGQEFEELLSEIPSIIPGFTMDQAYPFFKNCAIVKKLSADIITEVYHRYQRRLMDESREHLKELLLEKASGIQGKFSKNSSLTTRREAMKKFLERDSRYERMGKMAEERDQIILSFLPFLFDPSPLNCPCIDMCIDIVGTSILNDFSQNDRFREEDSGFMERFEMTRKNSGRRVPRIHISTMCGDQISVESLTSSLFLNDSIRPLNLDSNGCTLLEYFDEVTQNWTNLEISMSSFHSWNHKNDPNPSQLVDLIDGYLLVYDSRRPSSFNFAQLTIQKISETCSVNFESILVLAVTTDDVDSQTELELLKEGAELCKSIGARFSVIRTNSLNSQLMDFLRDVCEGQIQPIASEPEIRALENDRPTILAPTFTSSGIQLLNKPENAGYSRRPKPVNSNLRNRVTRTDPLIMSNFFTAPIEIQPAPLATPEAVDFSPAYSLVNDAVQTIIQVTGATPTSSFKNPPPIMYESSPDSRSTRSTTSTISGSSPAPRAVSASEVTRRSRTSCVSSSAESINRLHRTSNLLTLHPDPPAIEQKPKSLSIESLTKIPEKEKQGNRFVRKVATSFRLRNRNLVDPDIEVEKSNKKKSSVPSNPDQISSLLEKMATRSLPQSPRTDRKAKLYSSLNSTTEKVSNVLAWFPNKAPKKAAKNKSATHDLSSSMCTASTSNQGVTKPTDTWTSLCAASPSGIPVYLEKCIGFIENNGGFEQEGLYRVPGNQTHLVELEKRFLKTGDFDPSNYDTPVHVAATALKNFFICLKEPLVPVEYHSTWKDVMMAPDDVEKLGKAQRAILELPSANQTVLRYLVTHLAKVSCSPKTVMNANNLCKVWSPTLFRPVFTTYDQLSTGFIAFQLALELIILNSDSLFL